MSSIQACVVVGVIFALSLGGCAQYMDKLQREDRLPVQEGSGESSVLAVLLLASLVSGILFFGCLIDCL